MTTASDIRPPQAIMFRTIARVPGLVLVLIGLFNTMPSIPGLDVWVTDLGGNQSLVIRKFPYEYLYPLAFVPMMLIVALQHSFWVEAIGQSRGKRLFGAAMDIALVTMAIAVFLGHNVKVWGFLLVAVAIIVAACTRITVLIWYYLGADDINKYLITKLGGEPRSLLDGHPTSKTCW